MSGRGFDGEHSPTSKSQTFTKSRFAYSTQLGSTPKGCRIKSEYDLFVHSR